MTETRIKFSNIVQNQLPSYVREDFPLVSEFLSQYYISQEFKGAPVDLIQNIALYNHICPKSKIKNYHKCIINKHISLIYRIENQTLEIITLLFNQSDHLY